jgi:hypothetical protein
LYSSYKIVLILIAENLPEFNRTWNHFFYGGRKLPYALTLVYDKGFVEINAALLMAVENITPFNHHEGHLPLNQIWYSSCAGLPRFFHRILDLNDGTEYLFCPLFI